MATRMFLDNLLNLVPEVKKKCKTSEWEQNVVVEGYQEISNCGFRQLKITDKNLF